MTASRAYAGPITICVRDLFRARSPRQLALTAVLGLTALLPFSLPANPAQNPKRSIGNLSVDLSPLIKWWANRNGPRPLSAWVHLTGTVIGTNSGAWIVEAKIEPAGPKSKNSETAPERANENQRIVLRNPPLDDLIEFQQLTSRLVELNKQRAALKEQESQAKTRDQAVTAQQRASRRNRGQARVLAAEDKQLKQIEKQAETQEKPLDDELKEIKEKLAAYPKTDQYLVDCFALDLKYDSSAMRVYDHGRTAK